MKNSRQLELFVNLEDQQEGISEKTLFIPSRTFNPAYYRGSLLTWLLKFYDKNDLPKPKRLRRMKYEELETIFNNLLEEHHISMKGIVKVDKYNYNN